MKKTAALLKMENAQGYLQRRSKKGCSKTHIIKHKTEVPANSNSPHFKTNDSKDFYRTKFYLVQYFCCDASIFLHLLLLFVSQVKDYWIILSNSKLQKSRPQSSSSYFYQCLWHNFGKLGFAASTPSMTQLCFVSLFALEALRCFTSKQ